MECELLGRSPLLKSYEAVMTWKDGDETTAWGLVADDTWQDMGLVAYLLPRGRVGWEAAQNTRTDRAVVLQRLETLPGLKLRTRETRVDPEQRIRLVKG